jgi:2-polyprenyl-3-methyl-5-hydroxy-6-metoxy-1,4-benzoquinol methylase
VTVSFCKICELTESTVVETCEPPYCVVKCAGCGFVYVTPLPPPLDGHYSETYYEEWRDKQAGARSKMWKKRLRELLRYKKSGTLLDVGCGLGTFLDIARAAGFDVHGTEVSEYIGELVRKKMHIDLFLGDFANIATPQKTFDVITMWHTLEHMPDPVANLRTAHHLLKDDGLLVVAVPNVNNTVMKILYPLVRGKPLRLFSLENKELHLSHFSSKTLAVILRKTGFEIFHDGPDLSQVLPGKKIIDVIAKIVFMLTGKNVGEAMRVYAGKI